MRFGSEPAEQIRMKPSTSGTDLFFHGDSDYFVARLIAVNSLVIRVTPSSGNPITATFDTIGLSEKYTPIRELKEKARAAAVAQFEAKKAAQELYEAEYRKKKAAADAATAAAAAKAIALAKTTADKKAAEFEARIVAALQARAESGSAVAQYDLALRYLEGKGVTADPAKAREYLTQSAKAGNQQAADKLAELK